MVNDLIKSKVIVYTSSIFLQKDDIKEYKGFQCSAGVFNKGELISFYEAKEYRIEDDSLCYNHYIQNPLDTKVTNMNDYFEFLSMQNERSLINTKFEEVDLLNSENLTILEDKYKSLDDVYFNIIKLHMWFISNAILMNLKVKFNKIIQPLINDDETDYENFDYIKKSKAIMIDEINNYYQLIKNYIENL
jgi:hypothetical protein